MTKETEEYIKKFHNNDDSWVKYYHDTWNRFHLDDCKTVEEVEALECHKCSTKTGHWGWCDDNATFCIFKCRIKEILGINPNNHSKNIVDSIKAILGEEN